MERELDTGQTGQRAIPWTIKKVKKMEMKFATTLQGY